MYGLTGMSQGQVSRSWGVGLESGKGLPQARESCSRVRAPEASSPSDQAWLLRGVGGAGRMSRGGTEVSLFLEGRRDHSDQGHIEEVRGWRRLHSISNEDDADDGNSNSSNTAAGR